MKKVTKILSLSLVALSLFACDDILAKPDVVVNEDSLITIGDNKDIYNNNFEVIYDQLVSSGTSNSTIMKEIINNTAKKEISKFYNSENEFLLARDTGLQMVEVLEPEKDINGLEKIIVKCVIK